MNDRDSLAELFTIVSDFAARSHLLRTAGAMPYIQERFHTGCNIYYRRRLSICRMLIDLHLPISLPQLDVLLAAALSHAFPGDNIPADHIAVMDSLFSDDPQIAAIVSSLRHPAEEDEQYFRSLYDDKYALIIRLTERGALMEKLFEYPIPEARRFIRETREHFFPMCIYVRENYPEYRGAAILLMEKMRNLIAANEALLNRFEADENNLGNELLSLQEENAAMRTMILELKNAN